MASVTCYLDTRSKRKDGTHHLKLRISHNKRSFFVPLNIYLLPDQWDKEHGKIVSHAQSKNWNGYIVRERINAEDKLRELNSSGKLSRLSIDQLKNQFNSTSKSTTVFKEYAEYYIASLSRLSTRETYVRTLKLTAKFTKIDNLEFSDINLKWLRDFEKYLADTNHSINGRAIHFRNIRAIFNDAINNDVVGLELYPFRKFKIKSEATVKRSMTVEQLRQLRDYPCEPWQEKWRDMFMLIFYLIGINCVDLVGLREISGGRVAYRRSKTGKLYSIKVEPEALAIIEKYRGKTHLLDFGDKYADHRDFVHRLNSSLQKIGTFEWVQNSSKDNPKKNAKSITPAFPGITSYWARHTWATIAAELDIPKETIAAALGHGGNSVTDIYIKFDERKIDEANRKVLDYVSGACTG